MSKSLFLEALGGWFQGIMAEKPSEADSSSQEDQLSKSGKAPDQEPLGPGESYQQADAVYFSPNSLTGASPLDSHLFEDVVSGSGVWVDDTAEPRPDISLTEHEVAQDPGTISPKIASAVNGQEMTPDADSRPLSEERADQALAKTMVETLPRSRAGSPEESNYLPENLAELFEKKEFVNPQVKALLYGLDSINCRELADELHKFARDIGAPERLNAPPMSGRQADAGT